MNHLRMALFAGLGSSFLMLSGLTAKTVSTDKTTPIVDYQLTVQNDTRTNLEAEMTEKAMALIRQMRVEEKISQLMNEAPGIERLGILPYNWWSEALHGVARNGKATVFPQAIGLAATFDTALVRRVADAISTEGRAKFNISRHMGNYGVYAGLTYWSPNVNIFRDPRWGRGQETYGEDPYLTSCMGIAFVKGLQGDDPLYLKAAACAKHYAVHSGPEAWRHKFNATPSKKDLYETYLPAFEALVKEAHVEAVMSAYNRVWGESATAHPFLLTDLLRRQWGFKGHVVSDCDAVEDIYKDHQLAADAAQASAMALKSGLNLNCGQTFRQLQKALDEGLITENDLDAALLPLFMTRLKLGILTADDYSPYQAIPETVVCSEKHQELALTAACQSMVLLKNDRETLPLDTGLHRIFVTGPYAADAGVLLGNYYGLSDQLNTFLEGIVGKVSRGTTVNYKIGTLPTVPNAIPDKWNVGEARRSPVTIVFLGLSGIMEGEEGDAIASPNNGDKSNLLLPTHQLDFLRALRKNNPQKIITVVTGGSPMDLRVISELSDAVILAWYPGQAGGTALADLLFGVVSPSGHLPVTFPVTTDSLPPFEDYSMKGRTYKYMKSNILYPFGFGLTYGQTTYEKPLLESIPSKNGKTFRLACTLTNTGKYPIEEVPQLYVSTPGAGITTPLQSLVGFQRIALQPGEKHLITFTVSTDQLKMVMEDGTKRLLKGTYRLTIAGAAPCNRSEELNVPQCSVSFKL